MTVARYLLVVLLATLGVGCSLLRGGRAEVRKLDVEIRGNQTFSLRELHEAMLPVLESFDASPYPKSVVDDAAFELERFHLSQGFVFAAVRYDFIPAEGEAKAKALITIVEGPRVELGDVAFRGNRAFESKNLRKFFEPEAAGLFAKRPRWYVESTVKSRTDDVARYYRDRGYLDAVISGPYVTFTADHARAHVEVVIQEGVRYVLRAVTIAGESLYDAKELELAYAPFIGEPFVERASFEIQGRIEEFYGDRGHADVKVARTRRDSTDDGEVSLEFTVDPGPVVHVRDVVVKGNVETRGSFVRSRLLLERGDRYSRSKDRRSFSRLYGTGLFETVRMSLGEEPGNERDLEIEVVELPSLEVFMEPGWGSYEGPRVTVGAREKNVFRSGKIAQVEATVGRLDQHGKLSFIDPFVELFGRDVSADLSFFGREREEPSFTRSELGSGIRLTSRISRRLEVSTGYEYRLSDISDVDVGAVLPPDETDDVDISSVSTGVTYDTRDIIFAPTQGSLSKLSAELAAAPIGSELEFVRLLGTQSNFFPLGTDATLGVSFNTGWMAPIGATDTIPLQERFFNGGESSVRSFAEDELGPKSASGDPVGGEAYSVFSIEVRRTIVGRLHAAVFWDVGNVVADHSDYWDFADLRQGVGAGLRYDLPIGPIRLDGAINPHPRDDEASGALHFSVGLAF